MGKKNHLSRNERTLVGEWETVKNVTEMEKNKGEVSCDHGIVCWPEFLGPDSSVPEFVGEPLS